MRFEGVASAWNAAGDRSAFQWADGAFAPIEAEAWRAFSGTAIAVLGSAPATAMLFNLGETPPTEVRASLEHLVAERGPELLIIVGRDPAYEANAATLWADPRTQVQAWMIEKGYARHPTEVATIEDYSALDTSSDYLAAFRRRSAQELERWPIAEVRKERDLHMDMLLEGGRRSDAHLVRYVLAASQIRPADVVIDAACGLGYGLEVMRGLAAPTSVMAADISEFACEMARTHIRSDRDSVVCTDVTEMPWVDKDSTDLIVSFETVEHVYFPDKLLREFHRILKPGGRLVASVPNMWVDETGQDPNPDHHHVFDWSKFVQLLESCGFRALQGWSQRAGGAIKEHHAQRSMAPINIAAPPEDSEWCIVLAESISPTDDA